MKLFLFSRYFLVYLYIYNFNIISKCTEYCCCCCNKKDNNNIDSEQSEDKKPDKDTLFKELDSLLKKDIETIKNFPDDVKKTMTEVIFKWDFNQIIQGQYNYIKGYKDEINKKGITDKLINDFNEFKYDINLLSDTTKYLTHSLLWNSVWNFNVENYDKNNNLKNPDWYYMKIGKEIFGYDFDIYNFNSDDRHTKFFIKNDSLDSPKHVIIFFNKNLISKLKKDTDKIVKLEDNLYYVILSYNGPNSEKFVNENYSVNLNLKKNDTKGIYELIVEIHEKK